MLIPKKIHQCHTKGESALTEEEMHAINLTRKNNPDWQYYFYDLEKMQQFINEHYEKRYVEAFNKINPAYGVAQADYFRYLLINKVGGVYLDTKSVITKPLEQIINPDDKFIVFYWEGNPRGLYNDYGTHKEIGGDRREYQQWNIISTQNNRHLEQVIETVTQNIENYSILKHSVGRVGVIRTTGPIPFTNSIHADENVRIAGNNEVNGFLYRDDINYPQRVVKNHYSQMHEPILKTKSCYRIMIKYSFFGALTLNRLKNKVLKVIVSIHFFALCLLPFFDYRIS